MGTENDGRWISGFWRRIGAFVIDSAILGGAGYGLGLVFEKQFVELGGWSRLVGFCIALAYFGIMNSRICGGQTLGKKVLKIKVVNGENQSIDVVRSFARYSILGIPYFLNGAHFTSNALSSFWIYPLSFVIFGGMGSTVFLYIFNRVTRQSLHDLIVGTFVVNVNVEKQEPGTVWRPHLLVVAAFFILAAIMPVYTTNLSQSGTFRDLLSAQAAIMEEPSVSYASVSYGERSFSSATKGTKTTTSYVAAQAFLRTNDVADAQLAWKLAEILVKRYPESLKKDVIQIKLIYGYDIGIASSWHTFTHGFKPDEFPQDK